MLSHLNVYRIEAVFRYRDPQNLSYCFVLLKMLMLKRTRYHSDLNVHKMDYRLKR